MFFDFLLSRHRKIYMALALQYRVSPHRIRQLAHGSQYRNEKEHDIQHELFELGITRKHKHHEHHD